MKKLIAVIVCAALLASVPVFAEEKTIEDRVAELEQRVESLEKEIAELKGEPAGETADESGTPASDVTELSSGFYVVGEDVPEGTYTLTASHGEGRIYFYKSREAYEEHDYDYILDFHLVSQETIDSAEETMREFYEKHCDKEIKNLKIENDYFIVVKEFTACFTPKA